MMPENEVGGCISWLELSGGRVLRCLRREPRHRAVLTPENTNLTPQSPLRALIKSPLASRDITSLSSTEGARLQLFTRDKQKMLESDERTDISTPISMLPTSHPKRSVSPSKWGGSE